MFEDKEIARLKFIMTMNCNFRCDYCFEGGKSNLHLSADDCVALGKKVLSEMKQDHLTVLYFGGEPLLRFKDMKLTTEVLDLYAKKIGKRISFTFISNGTIISKELIDHFKRYRYYISISCDGIAEAHNLHRGYLNGQKDSFERVEKAIEEYLKIDRDLCMSMVVTNQNVQYLSRSFQYAINKGIRNFAISPVLDQQNFTPDPDAYYEQLIEVARIAKTVEDRIVINPPLDTTWSEDNSVRIMTMSSDSVNVELSPIGLTVVPERSKLTSIDFSFKDRIKTPASEELRKLIIDSERRASKLYKS